MLKRSLTRVVQQTRAQVGASSVVCGLNASADSFYSSQGRLGAHFDDRNEGLVPELILAHPGAWRLLCMRLLHDVAGPMGAPGQVEMVTTLHPYDLSHTCMQQTADANLQSFSFFSPFSFCPLHVAGDGDLPLA